MDTPPEPPRGVDDLHSLPNVASDRELDALRDSLDTTLHSETVSRLTEFVDDAPESPDESYRKEALEYVIDCIDYREQIRPESLRPVADLPDSIQRTTAGGWVWYRNGNESAIHDVSLSEASETDHGKYLFFAPDEVRILEDIVVEQFQCRPFRSAKLPTKPAKRDDWVLCLYQEDNRYWFKLRDEYHDPPTVRFRGFKTDEATRRGEYSEKFREKTQ